MSGGLFKELPEQAGPRCAEAEERPAPRLLRADRRQLAWRTVDLDGLVAADDVVRDVWAFVEQMDLSELYARIAAREGVAGHPAIDPQILMALWLYATIRGIGSARELDRRCASEIGFQWLCGGVGVNPHTLSDFRQAHGALLDRLLSESVAVLIDEGVVSLDEVALDGLRVRASAGAGSFRRRPRLEQLVEVATHAVTRLRRELAADPAVGERRRRAAQARAAADRAARLAAATGKLAEREAERQRRQQTNKSQTAKQGAVRVSTTDPAARVMKMPDGGWRPAYNAQFASDPKTQIIISVDVDTTGSDHGLIRPMLEQVKGRYRRSPQRLLVDGGFADAEDLEWAADPDNGAVAVFMAPLKNKHNSDPYAPRPKDGPATAAWRARMATPEGQAIYKRRAIHECVNADLRFRGLKQLTVRGVAKVRTIFTWFALAHNILRAVSLRRQLAASA